MFDTIRWPSYQSLPAAKQAELEQQRQLEQQNADASAGAGADPAQPAVEEDADAKAAKLVARRRRQLVTAVHWASGFAIMRYLQRWKTTRRLIDAHPASMYGAVFTLMAWRHFAGRHKAVALAYSNTKPIVKIIRKTLLVGRPHDAPVGQAYFSGGCEAVHPGESCCGHQVRSFRNAMGLSLRMMQPLWGFLLLKRLWSNLSAARAKGSSLKELVRNLDKSVGQVVVPAGDWLKSWFVLIFLLKQVPMTSCLWHRVLKKCVPKSVANSELVFSSSVGFIGSYVLSLESLKRQRTLGAYTLANLFLMPFV